MARVALGAIEPLGLDNIKRERPLEALCFCQRRVVADAQVALEPDQCGWTHLMVSLAL
jgi:hypothetical protein